MPRKKRTGSKAEDWAAMSDTVRDYVPHLVAWWLDAGAFSELRVKARDDGTTLAIAKGYDGAGGPVVCFGVGYDVITALMAIDSTINGGRWRVDKPWKPKSK